MLPLGKTEQNEQGISVLFLTPACVSARTSIQISVFKKVTGVKEGVVHVVLWSPCSWVGVSTHQGLAPWALQGERGSEKDCAAVSSLTWPSCLRQQRLGNVRELNIYPQLRISQFFKGCYWREWLIWCISKNGGRGRRGDWAVCCRGRAPCDGRLRPNRRRQPNQYMNPGPVGHWSFCSVAFGFYAND